MECAIPELTHYNSKEGFGLSKKGALKIQGLQIKNYN